MTEKLERKFREKFNCKETFSEDEKLQYNIKIFPRIPWRN